MLDLVLRGGVVVDGTGADRRVADVGVRDGRVVAVGQVDEAAAREVDVTGLVVAPGFIDLHTHYDAQLLWDPTASPSPLHGVTTALGGNCGFSIAPLGPDDATYIKRMMARVEGMSLASLDAGPDWDWHTFGEWLDRIDGDLAINMGFLVGHSTLRRVAMGEAAVGEPATQAQIEAMVALAHEAMAAGALGVSSSLGDAHTDGDNRPVPSRAATREEFLALAAAVGDHPGTTLEFIPAVGLIDDERMELMADMSLEANRPLNWNLLGSLSPVEIYEQQLEASDRAAARGAHVVALTLPDMMRLRVGRVLDDLPGWRDVVGLDEAGRREAVQDPERRAELRGAVERAAEGGLAALASWDLLELAEPSHPSGAPDPYVGRTVSAVAGELGIDPIDVLLDVVLPEARPLTLVLPSVVPSLGTSDEGWAARAEVWRDPRTVLGGSDAGAHVDLMCHANYTTVVLGNAVRDRGLLSLEEAVHQLTDVPARLCGLRDRGRIDDGAWADLVVFDPETVGSEPAQLRHDLPGGGERLYAGSLGVEHVFVAGQEVVAHGAMTGVHGGSVLRSGVDTDTVTVPAGRAR